MRLCSFQVREKLPSLQQKKSWAGSGDWVLCWHEYPRGQSDSGGPAIVGSQVVGGELGSVRWTCWIPKPRFGLQYSSKKVNNSGSNRELQFLDYYRRVHVEWMCFYLNIGYIMIVLLCAKPTGTPCNFCPHSYCCGMLFLYWCTTIYLVCFISERKPVKSEHCPTENR